jgi:Leucine-rich repeat (LRR) protein
VKILRSSVKTLQAFLSLSILHSSGCKSIESLLATIGQWQHLTKLCLQRCENFKELPHCIASLSSLSILDISRYNSIESLPTTIAQLQHLTNLWLTNCENLKELPQSIASLFSLSMLDLSGVIPLNHY